MPPHAPSFEKSCSGDRQRQEAGGQLLRGPGQRWSSFHGRGAEQRHQLPKQRPKTQPDLLAGVRGRSFRAADGGEPLAELAVRRTPGKVLVNVTVQRSLWPLHVMASADWSVADLVAAAVGIYVKEGRRPLLPATDPSTFGLHYSQFSLESKSVASEAHGTICFSFQNCTAQLSKWKVNTITQTMHGPTESVKSVATTINL
ncbi:unnamed protein product [Triticum turgidum subsp. durum]|uniref:DUF7054 domain-containing protein n=1 Tax=Triticum turgidum subsp. durum TaxID=4567 RepID=A0A9R1NW86_TRITD|nr:unnamed protein product [Triticum turgidum subsp. durum]